MSSSSKLSVITVVKDAANLLEETIQSVIAQKAKTEFDYLVVDGGSTDGTLEVIKKYADQITWWGSEQDNGIYDAMNKGWAAAADDCFVLFLGAGDKIIALPDTMNRYSPRDVVYGSVMLGEKRIFIPRADFHLKLYNSLHHQALLVNKALHPAPPFNCCYMLYADFDFNQRLMKNGANFAFDPKFLCYARPGGVSDHKCFAESLKVIFSNFGILWAALAFAGYYAMQVVPFLKRLRPVRER